MTFRVVCKVQKVSINCLIEWTQGPRRRTKAFLAFLAFHLESNVCLLTIESLEGQESTKQCGQLDDQKHFTTAESSSFSFHFWQKRIKAPSMALFSTAFWVAFFVPKRKCQLLALISSRLNGEQKPNLQAEKLITLRRNSCFWEVLLLYRNPHRLT